MARRGYLQRYLLIIRIISNNKFITLKELRKEVERQIVIYDDSESIGVSKRTIQRDFTDIKNIFNIEIIYSKRDKGYYLNKTSASDINKQLEYIDLIGTLDKKIEKFVFAEKRFFKGTEYLHPLISAITKSQVIEFRYRKFDNTVTKETRTVEPYALKEFRGRWYLLAIEVGGRLEESGQLKTWGLDRIENLQQTNKIFDKKHHISIEKEFESAFGIFSDEIDAEEVILSFTPESGRYNLSLPLHESQETLIDNKNEIRIKLKVKITYDFIMELLSQSESLNVISPTHLKNKLINIHKKAISLLNKTE